MALTLTADELAAIRASPTVRCWKRADDLPSHLRVQQGRVPIDDAISLAYASVFPTATTPLRGVVLFLHGINEHSARYFHVFEELAELGFGVVAYDLRGHGQSHQDVAGMIGHVNSFQSFTDDTNAVLAFAKRELLPQLNAAASVPWLIMGMSLGTLVSLHTVLSEQHSFQGIVLVAPAVSVEMTPVLKGLSLFSGLLSSLAPTARIVPGVNEKWICRDPLYRKDYDADLLATREPVTCRMGAETMAAMQALQQDTRVEDAASAFCGVPLFMIMGSEDKVTSLPLAQRFYDRVHTKDKTFELIQGAYHILFEDMERESVLAKLKAWLLARFPVMKDA